MDFGIYLATSAHSWKVVKRAEELGFVNTWFYDTPMLNAELFTAMGAAAVQTARIRLGTGVLVPSNRTEPVVACALATLNALAPGRIDFGVGTGFTSRRALGLPAITAARLEDYVRTVMAILRGETVEWKSEGAARKVRFLNPELDLINIQEPIRLYVSAFGPKMRQLAARLGAGLMGTAADPGALADMRSAWADQGRDPADLLSVMIAGGAVLKEGEAFDSPRVKAQAGPMAAMVFHDEIERESLLKSNSSGGGTALSIPPRFKPQLDAYRQMYASYEPADARYLTNHRGHLLFLKPGEERQMTAEVIRAYTYTATKPELVERIRTLRDSGLRQFAIELRHGHEINMLEDWADVFAAV
jgi:5,10-methylenetetrahydromethanopterin reductase